jgi:putative methyltransferase (TIGR04325 family)
MLKSILPPMIVSLARRWLKRALPSPEVSATEWEYVPEGWQYKGRARGWDVESVVMQQLKRWPRYLGALQGAGPLGISHEARDPAEQNVLRHNVVMSFAYVLALAAHRKERLSVMDWGGGLGYYYALARALMPELVLEYHCKELPLICAAGRKSSPEIRFHEDDSCLGRKYDLVLASSSLQYSEDWRKTLGALAAAADQWLYLALLPATAECGSFVFIQRAYPHGYDTEYLGWCLNRRELIEGAARLELELRREFLHGYRPAIAGAPEPCEYRGFLFEKAHRSSRQDE